MTIPLIDLKDELKAAIDHASEMGVQLTTGEYGIWFEALIDNRVKVHIKRQECYVCALSALVLYRQELCGGSIPYPNQQHPIIINSPFWTIVEVLDLDVEEASAFVTGYDGDPLAEGEDANLFNLGRQANAWAFAKEQPHDQA